LWICELTERQSILRRRSLRS